MQSLKDISLGDLAKQAQHTGVKFAKSGAGGKEKGEYVDPFTLDVAFPVEITGEEITTRPSGTPQVALSVSIIKDDGTLQKAGKVWVDLPVLPEGADMSAEDEATHMQKSGDKFLRFLRAIDQERFSVFASIDKSDAKKWVYLDFAGNPVSEKARTKRADEIDAAVMAVAEGLVAGTLSLVGSKCFITKRANPNNTKYPFVNFSAGE